jgi:hypothetical protein
VGLNDDALLLLLQPFTLGPVAGGGELFGDHAARREQGVSLADHAGGFIVAGLAERESRDAYFVNANGKGVTDCSMDWPAQAEPPQFPVTQLIPQATAFLAQASEHMRTERRDTRERICP